MADREVVPFTPDAEVNKTMHDNLVEVLGMVDRGELASLCIVVANRNEVVTSYRVGEKRLNLAGALVEALIRTARSDP